MECTLKKYNNGFSHPLDTYPDIQTAIAAAKALHDPAWPVWQGLNVIGRVGNTIACLFDTREEGRYYVLGAASDNTPASYISGPWPRNKAEYLQQVHAKDYTCCWIALGQIDDSGEICFRTDF